MSERLSHAVRPDASHEEIFLGCPSLGRTSAGRHLAKALGDGGVLTTPGSLESSREPPLALKEDSSARERDREVEVEAVATAWGITPASYRLWLAHAFPLLQAAQEKPFVLQVSPPDAVRRGSLHIREEAVDLELPGPPHPGTGETDAAFEEFLRIHNRMLTHGLFQEIPPSLHSRLKSLGISLADVGEVLFQISSTASEAAFEEATLTRLQARFHRSHLHERAELERLVRTLLATLRAAPFHFSVFESAADRTHGREELRESVRAEAIRRVLQKTSLEEDSKEHLVSFFDRPVTIWSLTERMQGISRAMLSPQAQAFVDHLEAQREGDLRLASDASHFLVIWKEVRSLLASLRTGRRKGSANAFFPLQERALGEALQSFIDEWRRLSVQEHVHARHALRAFDRVYDRPDARLTVEERTYLTRLLAVHSL